MAVSETSEISAVVHRVQSWPTSLRITLARRILETLEETTTPKPLANRQRGYSAEEVRAMLRMDKPAPDDTTVKQWIEEHRMEKYGK